MLRLLYNYVKDYLCRGFRKDVIEDIFVLYPLSSLFLGVESRYLLTLFFSFSIRSIEIVIGIFKEFMEHIRDVTG
ncbi:unnamed protein product [Meloidogyne enterolobii]|uniref:Uncharacterized protein n=1 Tax=Meloidogyne enterolobii TaxID=390850 RepID=A0ACB1AXM0_MELEN